MELIPITAPGIRAKCPRGSIVRTLVVLHKSSLLIVSPEYRTGRFASMKPVSWQ
jgi:hypothetical protein